MGDDVGNAFGWLAAPVPTPSREHAAAAAARQGQLTKPAGALGRLEEIAIRLAGQQRRERPRIERPEVIVFAGDHGIAAQGVSAYPAEVTVQMIANFVNGGAAISVLARAQGARLSVVDAGTLASSPIPGAITDKPCCGTRDFSRTAALTRRELAHALGAGRRAVGRAIADGADLMILGEMGIANTTTAAAIAAALTGRAPEQLVGRGTGLDEAGVAHKASVVAAALAHHGLLAGPGAVASGREADHALAVLEAVGGLEIAALSGAIVRAAQAGLPVLVDGFIVTVAALAALRLNPSAGDWLLYSHRSQEAGHAIVLEALDARPLVDLAMRLGEGSGAAVALSIVRLALAVHDGMATFEEAAVAGRSAS
ncbi:MAG: nicotinate-nucleotide--dimethylbenzimidazole phosphoribosyltransferase [Rhizobiales bacterium]|nr:nicotinate-nucleotide--dimethylbenzimidazole phosphoribosyltransferase [Hyphomicrobiales bacterium]